MTTGSHSSLTKVWREILLQHTDQGYDVTMTVANSSYTEWSYMLTVYTENNKSQSLPIAWLLQRDTHY